LFGRKVQSLAIDVSGGLVVILRRSRRISPERSYAALRMTIAE